MVQAEISKQLMIRVDNRVGSLAEVTSFLSASGINLIAICAYEIEGLVSIMFVTDDNNATKGILERNNIKVQEEEVILLTIDNKPGALQKITDKIAEAGINLKLIYGSVAQNVNVSRIVLLSDNNLDAMMIIKTELERG